MSKVQGSLRKQLPKPIAIGLVELRFYLRSIRCLKGLKPSLKDSVRGLGNCWGTTLAGNRYSKRLILARLVAARLMKRSLDQSHLPNPPTKALASTIAAKPLASPKPTWTVCCA